MSTVLGSLRRLVLAPSLSDVTFTARGFPVTPSPVIEGLEAIPQAVICGFEWAIEAKGLWEVRRRLDMVEPELRGFAYEGAAMAFTVRDTMRGDRTRQLLSGPGEKHLLLAYIGIGFAMARLPRPLWRKVIPDLAGSVFHPIMSWLAVDGYGFDRAYFDTKRWVDDQFVPAPYPWLGAPDYFLRAVDQGVGRALWFIHGANPDDVATAIRRFADHRRADLWAGVGLAASFAGGCQQNSLDTLRFLAAGYEAELALGSVFAVTARTQSGYVPEHSEIATAVLTGMSATDAVAVAVRTIVLPDQQGSSAVPPYEVWRQRIRDEVAKERSAKPR